MQKNNIKRIKYLIEQLNINELKELNTLLEIPFSKGSEYPNVFGGFGFDAQKWARKIENGEVKETPELLMAKSFEKEATDVAHWLAYNSKHTLWFTDNKEVLMAQDMYGDSVAHILMHKHPTWATIDPEILSLKNKEGIAVKNIKKLKRARY